MTAQRGQGTLAELVRLFGKLGLIAFGGPAAHIGMMEDEVVVRRAWLPREHFLDLIGATNLIPGPNSTEMVMHVGYERAGWRGLMVAGAAFILPAVLVTGAFAYVYVRFGSLPSVTPFLFGIKPAVLAVILGALWRLGRTAIKGWRLAVLAGAVAGAVLGGAGEVVSLLAGGVLGMAWLASRRAGPAQGRDDGARGPAAQTSAGVPETKGTDGRGFVVPPVAAATIAPASGSAVAAAAISGVSLWKLGLFFLKVGAVLYGSGYVLVAFLEGGLVQNYHWLTHTQLLDAIAVGQFTPGPVLSTATFIGYLVAGVPGAAVATAGIFLPSFFFVAALNPVIPRLRRSRWMSAFLDAVNAAAVALMLAVLLQLGASTLTTWPAWLIAGLAVVAALRFRVNSAWLVLGGAGLGWALGLLTA
jgi:chromate transporter